jgi:MoaA/NifB/PqqE/SkfB family radical SAM enzyme
MNCEILETLYLRCNGDVPCNDDAGENVLLGTIRSQNPRWTAASLLANHRYRHIREKLQHGEMPWPDACRQCAFFRPHQPFTDELARRRIRKIQVEPSLTCRLRCPGCSNQYQVRVRPAPLQMELSLFARTLQALRDDGYAVAEIEYCGQGEPLMHPQFPEFVRVARDTFPSTHQRLITSGNFDFPSATGGERLDEIMVSCDGVFAESYARYRIGGAVERPIRFMRDVRAFASRVPTTLIWKYILFEWNDSPEELGAAQELAEEIGVNWLLFVYTHSAGKSRRHAPENDADFPIRGARITTNATPVHYRLDAAAANVA